MADEDEGTAHLKRLRGEAQVASPGFMMRYDKRAGSPMQKSQMREAQDMADSLNRKKPSKDVSGY